MKPHFVFLAAAALLVSGGLASAQQQYDSLGSPTPAPNQKASPITPAPNMPKAGDSVGSTTNNSMNDADNKTNAGTKGTSYTTGAGADKMPASGINGGVNTGSSTPTYPTINGGTPSGLTQD